MPFAPAWSASSMMINTCAGLWSFSASNMRLVFLQCQKSIIIMFCLSCDGVGISSLREISGYRRRLSRERKSVWFAAATQLAWQTNKAIVCVPGCVSRSSNSSAFHVLPDCVYPSTRAATHVAILACVDMTTCLFFFQASQFF